ncbi:MAG: hypothetical protein KDA89_25000, partial [Planctomycetaceae bacterium]|nr:hypothetical protein [Planctomycetaceae bacterium]
MNFSGSTAINAGNNTVRIAPLTTGRAISLGGADSATALGLTDGELDLVSAAAIQIGNAATGTVTISAPITRNTTTSILVETAADADILFSATGQIVSAGGDVTLTTSGTGSIQSGSAAADITTQPGVITLNAGSGGIGSAVNPLAVFGHLTASTLSDAPVFLASGSPSTGTTIVGAGLNAGAGTITLSAGRFLLNADNLINDGSVVIVDGGNVITAAGTSETVADTRVLSGSLWIYDTWTSDVVVNDSGLLGGSGIVNGNVSGTGILYADGFEGPFTINGNLSFSGTVEEEAFVTLWTDGVNYFVFGELIVNGSADISNAELLAYGLIDPSPGQTIGTVTILSNDGTDPTPAFRNYGEGDTIDIDGHLFRISYSGGDGNDVTLSEVETFVTVDAGGNLVVTDIASASADTLTLRFDSTAAEYVISTGSHVAASDVSGVIHSDAFEIRVAAPLVTGDQIRVLTGDGDDSLTVDFSSGSFDRTIVYEGGAQSSGGTGDSLVITGNAAPFALQTITHTGSDSTGAGTGFDGTIDVDGQVIAFTGLEPVTLASAVDVVVNLPDG